MTLILKVLVRRKRSPFYYYLCSKILHNLALNFSNSEPSPQFLIASKSFVMSSHLGKMWSAMWPSTNHLWLPGKKWIGKQAQFYSFSVTKCRIRYEHNKPQFIKVNEFKMQEVHLWQWNWDILIQNCWVSKFRIYKVKWRYLKAGHDKIFDGLTPENPLILKDHNGHQKQALNFFCNIGAWEFWKKDSANTCNLFCKIFWPYQQTERSFLFLFIHFKMWKASWSV